MKEEEHVKRDKGLNLYISQLQNEGYSRDGKEVVSRFSFWLICCALAVVTVLIVFAPAWL